MVSAHKPGAVRRDTASSDVHSELRALALATTGLAVRRLVALGISHLTIANMGLHHYSFGVGSCLDVDDGLFVPSNEGRVRLVLPVYDEGELVDLVALSTDRPHDTRLRTGEGWALGLERGIDDHRWDELLVLNSSPLDWMRAGCSGLCILDWDAPEIIQLMHFDEIHCEDRRLEPLLRSALARPSRMPNISSKLEIKNAA